VRKWLLFCVLRIAFCVRKWNDAEDLWIIGPSFTLTGRTNLKELKEKFDSLSVRTFLWKNFNVFRNRGRLRSSAQILQKNQDNHIHGILSKSKTFIDKFLILMNSKECSMQMGFLNIHEGKERKVRRNEIGCCYFYICQSVQKCFEPKKWSTGFQYVKTELRLKRLLKNYITLH
jgi:hypothetical protein